MKLFKIFSKSDKNIAEQEKSLKGIREQRTLDKLENIIEQLRVLNGQVREVLIEIRKR